MRIGAIVLNVILLIATPILCVEWGEVPAPDDGWFFVYFLLVIVTPLFTLATLFLPKPESWLSLYFKRKAAEERQRIREIENQEGSQQRN